jgi:hypothetical protein
MAKHTQRHHGYDSMARGAHEAPEETSHMRPRRSHDGHHPARAAEHGAVNPKNAMGQFHLGDPEPHEHGRAGRAVGGSHNRAYGKDHPENFIEGALTGIPGASESIRETHIGHGQRIVTAAAMDNVELAAFIETSIFDEDFHGGPEYLGHSLKGVSAVNEDIGAAGPVHHHYVEDH